MENKRIMMQKDELDNLPDFTDIFLNEYYAAEPQK